MVKLFEIYVRSLALIPPLVSSGVKARISKFKFQLGDIVKIKNPLTHYPNEWIGKYSEEGFSVIVLVDSEDDSLRYRLDLLKMIAQYYHQFKMIVGYMRMK